MIRHPAENPAGGAGRRFSLDTGRPYAYLTRNYTAFIDNQHQNWTVADGQTREGWHPSQVDVV